MTRRDVSSHTRAGAGPASGPLPDPRHERAAELLAADDLTDEVIARTVGVCRQTLAYWKKDPTFQARVRVHRERLFAIWEAEHRDHYTSRQP